MDLFLYITMGRDRLFFPGSLLSGVVRAIDLQTLHIDEHSSPELIEITTRALDEADRLFCYCHCSGEAGAGPLAAVFKKLVVLPVPVYWYQQGDLGRLAIFRRLFKGDFEENGTDECLMDAVLQFFPKKN